GVLLPLAGEHRLAPGPGNGVHGDVAVAEEVDVGVGGEVRVADHDEPAPRGAVAAADLGEHHHRERARQVAPRPPPPLRASGPDRGRAGWASAIAHAESAVRAMLSAATPGTSRATSTVRAEGSTTPLSIGLRSGSETGLPRRKCSTTAARPSVARTRCS